MPVERRQRYRASASAYPSPVNGHEHVVELIGIGSELFDPVRHVQQRGGTDVRTKSLTEIDRRRLACERTLRVTGAPVSSTSVNGPPMAATPRPDPAWRDETMYAVPSATAANPAKAASAEHDDLAPVHYFISMLPMPPPAPIPLPLLSFAASMACTGTVTEIFPAFSNVSVSGNVSPALSGFFSPISMM